ncbi:membrane-targeted effector domain-containing toxin [Pseudomonas synxantha]|uniref:Membrane-targeted effector domain-containing toxin n=1 Tax=Pseudomonas synxantha TaxID=47883 RepID=A0ABS0UHL5_9PSED|nr:membrane-targeted effector domain-containing toxin [Pseudomonas synxantha]MBI6565083.1 membrane-targeted effector domain-containing toxin [Pseudomonas synxantha]MBI6580269.1 membrane-targeted effector domain-containing toxin [Pseudomonas synxantha]MBI6641554.1 membrane-targeted effector domain-containing toxin [Pseudomonas synxantha]
MSSSETRTLPNAADKAALKALAGRVILACPSLHDTAHETARGILKKHGIESLDPDEVYYHRFKAAQSSSLTFTGWEHVLEKPYESTTLTELVIHRFRATDYDNADLLDLYGGFYTKGPEYGDFNQTNEVRLHANEVLKDFWALKFSDLYRDKLDSFWRDHADAFRTQAKCNFLSKAVQALELKHLSAEDFHTCITAVAPHLSWPVSLAMLQTDLAPGADAQVAALDLDGHVATNLLRITDTAGRQVLYVPGDQQAFKVFETAAQLHWWMLGIMDDKKTRDLFLCHFSLTDREAMTDGITDLMNRLVQTWGKSDHHMINQKNQAVTTDAFSWLRDRTRAAMYDEAEQLLTTNAQLSKKIWIGYLSAGLKIFGPLAVIGWPVALPVLGASIANLALNIDQAVNGRTSAERKAGVKGSVFSAIDTLFNLAALHGPGPIAEVGADVDAAEAAEMAKYDEALNPETAEPASPSVPAPPALPQLPGDGLGQIPSSWRRLQGLDGATAMTEGGRFEQIYRINANPSTLIKLKDAVFYVRYEADVNGGGTWAIIDPLNPHASTGSLPVRLNAEGEWERVLRPSEAMRGGSPMDTPTTSTRPPLASDYRRPSAYGEPGFRNPSSSLPTPFDLKNQSSFDIGLAMSGGPDYIKPIITPTGEAGSFSTSDYFINPMRAKILSSARNFFSRPFFASTLPERPALPAITPGMSPEQLIEKSLANAKGLVIAESPNRVASTYLLIKQMPNLAKQGVKTLYLHRFYNDLHQLDLDTFARSGVMPDRLGKYLRELDPTNMGRFNTLELLHAARDNQVRIQASECLANYLPKGSAMDEQMSKNFVTSEILRLDQAKNGVGKWVVLTGPENTNTFRGVAGISEINGGTSLRVTEELGGEGSQIKITYGPKVNNLSAFDQEKPPLDALDTDLSLQVPMRESEQIHPYIFEQRDLERTLSSPGDCVMQQTRDELTLIHRNRLNNLVHNRIQHSDAGYFIDRDAFPRLNGAVYKTLPELRGALRANGLTLKGLPPAKTLVPTIELERPAVQAAVETTVESGAALAPSAIPTGAVEASLRPEIPPSWEANEILEGRNPVSEPGRYQGIYRLESNPAAAILLNDTPYYVQYINDVNGGGHWAIINPEKPFSFSEAIPVRFNAQGEWEVLPRLGLKGGAGQLLNRVPGRRPVPTVQSPAVAYEIPPDLRPPLENAAAGPGTAKYALSDEGVNLFDNGADPYAPFKSRRQQLFKDAVAFLRRFRAANRPPIPSVPAKAPTATWLEALLEDGRGIVVGEAHSGVGSKQLLIEHMELLAQKNVKTLYCEHLLRDFHQAALDSFFESGEMPETLRRYLQSLDTGMGTDPLGQYTFMELIKAARAHKIRIQAIDCLASYRTDGFIPAVTDSQIARGAQRHALMNYYASTVIRADQAAQGAHKWLALVGNTHVSSYKGVPGLSELEEVHGLRVEDVAPGQSQGIIPDPGIPAAGEEGAVKSDLLFQSQIPRKPATAAEFDALLQRAGTFTVDSSSVSPILKHRSKLGELVSTDIRKQNGYFFIERPNWPSVSGKRFDSLKALFAALEDMGMVMVGKPVPL